ncbi:MAG: ABC transporter ATP-binding protein [Sulfolobales archaeon]|nr:ABC transporter ATP-binding protein [Sulfolobales archaeon]MCX8208951.1 ABC transporter ATP-binding protein [Sulfolobales archaeon]MDW8011276.1 ABC transporter ATP-binding protein [Sulfolobales archaeon]
MSYILETVNLVKRFGGLVAVNNANIKIKRNSITMLMGPNGAGKTTFVNVCTGVLRPDEGRVFFNPTGSEKSKMEITGWPPHKVYKLGFVRTFQIPQPFLALTVLENVLAALGGRGENPLVAPFRWLWVKNEEDRVAKAFEILKKVGLEEYWDWEAYKLGAGQLKMLEIARALAVGAKLVALDEPIGGTDPAHAHEIFKHVQSLARSTDITFLVIEHRIDIALPFADYVYVMDRGSVISMGTPDEVANDPKVVEVYIGGR